MSLVSQVKQNVECECIVHRCQKGQCSLKLDNLPGKFLLIDMDHERAPKSSQNTKKCDYIFIGDDSKEPWVAPLELKSGKFSASDVVEQLQAGAGVADSIIPPASETRFRPIVVHGKGIHRAELDRLQKMRVRYRSRDYPVGKARCGTSLVVALNKAQGV